MSHRHFIIPIAIALTAASCTHQTTTPVEPTDISFTSIETDSLIGRPISVHCINDTTIVINDNFGNQLIKEFNLATGAMTQGTAQPGMGPGEVIHPIRCAIADDTIYVLSLASKDLYTTPVSSLKLSKQRQLPPETTGIYHLPDANRFVAPVMHFQSTEATDNVYAYVYDRDFNKVQKLSGFPALWSTEKELDNRILSKFHQIQGVVSSGNTMAILETHVLRLYNIDDVAIEHTRDIQLFPYEYKYSTPSPGSEVANTKLQDGFKIGAKDISLHNGRFLITVNNSIKGDDANDYSTSILEVDKDGNITAEYRPDIPVQPYTMTTTPDGTVVVFTDGENIYPATAHMPV